MHPQDLKTLNSGSAGKFLVTIVRNDQVELVPLGTYDDIRYKCNQLSCLLHALALARLTALGHSAKELCSSGCTPGNPRPDTTHDELYQVTTQATTCARAEALGRGLRSGCWPDSYPVLPGFRTAPKALEALNLVLTSFTFWPTVPGGIKFRALAARTRESLELAHTLGYRPHDEEGLLRVVDLLAPAQGIHFYHTIV